MYKLQAPKKKTFCAKVTENIFNKNNNRKYTRVIQNIKMDMARKDLPMSH